MRARHAPWLLILVACDSTPEPVDADGDGYIEDDCDDKDEAVSPGAVELCNNIDDDCNGIVDDDPDDSVRVYADLDQDGHGDPLNSTRVCPGVPGYVDSSDDCDDTTTAIFPGAAERCNGIDDDCDGLIDEDAEDLLTWFADGDGDGHGDPDRPVEACEQPSGAVSVADDCDDGNVLANPSADEIWYDGIDQDCAGGNDYDADRDGHDGPGYGDDCDDNESRVYPGRTETCNDGLDNDCDGTANDCGLGGLNDNADAEQAWTSSSYYGRAGSSLAALGDSDGDGVPELAVGVPYGAGYSGLIHIVPADTDGPLDTAEVASLTGTTTSYAGNTMVSGDLDQDGYTDLVVGAQAYRTGAAYYTGAAFVAYGPFSGERSLSDTQILSGESSSSYAGFSVDTVTDIDGDGMPEVAVGAPYYRADGSTLSAGAVYIAFSDGLLADGSATLEDADVRIIGDASTSYIGQSVAGIGDIDGDGVGDLAARSYITGDTLLFAALEAGAYTAADATVSFAGAGAYAFGSSLAALGDLDGDGYDDYSLSSGSSSYIMSGSSTSTADALWYIANLQSSDVAAVGDVDGDGVTEIFIGEADYYGASGAYLFSADSEGLVRTTDAFGSFQGNSGDLTGSALVGPGDVDGDGYVEVALSAPGAGGYLGEVYLFYGGGL